MSVLHERENQLDEELAAILRPFGEDIIILSLISPLSYDDPGTIARDNTEAFPIEPNAVDGLDDTGLLVATPSSNPATIAREATSTLPNDPTTLDEAEPLLAAPLNKAADQTNRFATRELLSPWFPKIDHDNPKSQTFTKWRSQRHILLYIALGLATLVFIVNLTGWILFQTKWKGEDGFGILFHGDCTAAHRLNLVLHLIINVLSTLLMAASNVCMQLLSAPTRSEVNAAHHKKWWLDIGTPSIRNLRSISTQRLGIWCILGMASIPLHFFYNSVIFPTVPVNAFIWAMVTPDFVIGGAWNLSETISYEQMWPGIPSDPGLIYHDTWRYFDFYDKMLEDIQQKANATTIFDRLENAACFAQYRQLLGDHSDLLMVTTGRRVNETTANVPHIPAENVPSAEVLLRNSVVAYGEDGKATWETGWNFCGDTNGVPCIQPNTKLDGTGYDVSNWGVGGFLVDYCLSRQNSLDMLCSVEYSLPLLTVVCCFNFLKVMCIAYTVFHFSKKGDKSLSILGDAVSSFLEHQDSTTVNMSSVISKATLAKEPAAWDQIIASTWSGRRARFYRAASRTRWLFLFFSVLALFISASAFLANGISALRYRMGNITVAGIFSMGFGGVNIVSMLGILQGNTDSSLYKNVFFANSWQFQITFIYLILNSIVSAIMASAEWDRFFTDRKFLRVTSPVGMQRSSYSVSMPAKYGVPLIAVFGILHWSISQSVFVLRIERYYSNGEGDGYLISCGFSCYAIVVSIALGLALLIAVGVLGAQRFPNGMPLAATCSAAISAACHPPAEDTEPHLFSVRWGVVESDVEGRAHCAFTTARDVRVLEEGELMM